MSQRQKPQAKQNRNKAPKQKKKTANRNPPVLIQQIADAPISRGVRGRIPDPRFRAGKGGSICVRHAELIGSVSSTGDAFSVAKFPINPGMFTFTPWLSAIARNYESYHFKRLAIKYVAACPTTTPGQVYVTCDFDASDPPPASEQVISNYEGTRYSAPWDHQRYPCLPHNLSKRKTYYCRTQALSANQDIVLYDTGNLFVATVGTGTNSLGKLWVEYDVEFTTPELNVTPAGLALYGRLNGADNFATPPTQTGNLPLEASVAGNILTLTSIAPYSGILAATFGGAAMTVCAVTEAGGADSVIRSQCVNAAGTSINASIALTYIAPGQSTTIACAGTTSYNLRIGQYDNALV